MSSSSGSFDGLVETIRASRLPTPPMRRRLREEAELSLRDVAAALDVNAMTVLRWEKGACPRRENALKYRALLDALRTAAG